MAIAPGVPGLEVTVEVDNTPLPEHRYDDKDSTEADNDAYANSVITYLEVPSGAEFSIRWLMKEPFDSARPTHAGFMLDGTYMNGPFMECGDKDGSRGFKYNKITSNEDSTSATQMFRFSELQIDNEHHSTEGLKRQLEGIGTITIYLYYVISEQEAHNPIIPRLDLSPLGPINEKISQKGAPTPGDVLTHQTSLTAPQTLQSSKFHEVQCEPEPFASFTFHYRSTHALKSLGIIPRTPSPTPSRSPTLGPSPGPRDPDTMTREELIAELSRVNKSKEEPIRIKHERVEDPEVEEDEVWWMGTRPVKRRSFVVLNDSKDEVEDEVDE